MTESAEEVKAETAESKEDAKAETKENQSPAGAYEANEVVWAWFNGLWYPGVVVAKDAKLRDRPDAIRDGYNLVLWLGDGRVSAMKSKMLRPFAELACLERGKLAPRYVKCVELVVSIAAARAEQTPVDPSDWETWARKNSKLFKDMRLSGDFYSSTRGEESKERSELAKHPSPPSRSESEGPKRGGSAESGEGPSAKRPRADATPGEKPSRTAGKKKFKSALVIKAEATGEKVDYDRYFASAAAEKGGEDDWKSSAGIGFGDMTAEEFEYRRRKKLKKEKKRREREMMERGGLKGSLFSSNPLKHGGARRMDKDGMPRPPVVRRQRGAPKDEFTEAELALYTLPLDKGWRRELVSRKNIPEGKTKAGDVYYHAPRGGRKLRSRPDVMKILDQYPDVTIDNFSFGYIPTGHSRETDH